MPGLYLNCAITTSFRILSSSSFISHPTIFSAVYWYHCKVTPKKQIASGNTYNMICCHNNIHLHFSHLFINISTDVFWAFGSSSVLSYTSHITH
jgi:hypothetical protein